MESFYGDTPPVGQCGGDEAAFKAAVYMARRKSLSTEHVSKQGPEGEAKFLLVKDEHERNMMTEKLIPGSWLIYKSCGDEKEPFWLGRTRCDTDWDDKYQWHNDSDEAVEVGEGG